MLFTEGNFSSVFDLLIQEFIIYLLELFLEIYYFTLQFFFVLSILFLHLFHLRVLLLHLILKGFHFLLGSEEGFVFKGDFSSKFVDFVHELLAFFFEANYLRFKCIVMSILQGTQTLFQFLGMFL